MRKDLTIANPESQIPHGQWRIVLWKHDEGKFWFTLDSEYFDVHKFQDMLSRLVSGDPKSFYKEFQRFGTNFMVPDAHGVFHEINRRKLSSVGEHLLVASILLSIRAFNLELGHPPLPPNLRSLCDDCEVKISSLKNKTRISDFTFSGSDLQSNIAGPSTPSKSSAPISTPSSDQNKSHQPLMTSPYWKPDNSQSNQISTEDMGKGNNSETGVRGCSGCITWMVVIILAFLILGMIVE